MKEEHFLKLARKESKKSDNEYYKLGCVIVRGSKILGMGHNLLKTHPKSPHAFRSTHAEFMATISAGFEIKGATVYVFRENKNGTLAMSRPCDSCWKFLSDSGVKKIVYSADGTFKQEKMR